MVLVAANLLVLAWTQGWLAPWLAAPGATQREPERLAQQVNPERVRVLPPAAAGSAVAAARSAARLCLEVGPVPEPQLGAAEAALVQAGVAPGSWARVAPAAGPGQGVWLRITQMEPELQASLRGLKDPALPGPFRPCEAPR